jgi:hypothetical protein
VGLVDLVSARDEDLNLVKWKEQGEGLATWGPNGVPICRCKVVALATWFRGALAMDKGAEMELMSFLGGLSKEQSIDRVENSGKFGWPSK